MPSLKSHASNHSSQYVLQLIQVFFVGLTLGMTRTVVPAVADSEFGVRKGDLALITTFVLAFGIVKGVMNFIAGALSERIGRKRVLVAGWIIALPVPFMIWLAAGTGAWTWIVAATALLGVNQGLTWSMTLTSKLDLTRPDRRGLTNGLNECSGYFAVAVAGVLTAAMAQRFGAAEALVYFGYAAIVPALLMALLLVRETKGVAAMAAATHDAVPMREVIAMSVRNRDFFALCQCGLVEKFVDCLMWIALPVVLVQRGVPLRDVGWVPGAYAATWGFAQIFTGPLSDRLGRKPLIVAGMLLCAAGVAVMPMLEDFTAWSACAAAIGLGMAMLYPTLGAAVSDFAPASWRATALGVYRFWRDLGYAIGAAIIGVLALLHCEVEQAFRLIAAIVAVSGVATAILGRSSQSTNR